MFTRVAGKPMVCSIKLNLLLAVIAFTVCMEKPEGKIQSS
jgi:hypothetical protein